jgi:proton-translocating NAD(P)+ transhydrogenase subunit alpha
MMTVVGAAKEAAAAERRVALTPDAVIRLRQIGFDVMIETGAGAAAWFSDSAYREAGAEVVAAGQLASGVDVLACINPPDSSFIQPGRVVVGMLDDSAVAACVAAQATAVSLLRLPRTMSRAQPMDALTSQAGVAGYKAAVLAADTYGRYLPMMMTAAGTARPASVLVLGAGVAGLAAIGTARRLGAMVTGYDIRPEAAAEVRSVGAKFLDLTGIAAGEGTGGYARSLTEAERESQQLQLQQHVADYDVVITTAAVPGRKPPVLVTEAAIKAMRPGSVIVDISAGLLGGNVEGVRPDATTVLADGVMVIGAGNLASEMAPGASTAYGRNIVATLAHLFPSAQIAFDSADEIQQAIVVGPQAKESDK